MLRKNNGVVAVSNSVLNESKHRVELIKFSHPASFFLFELKARKRASTRQQAIQNGSLSFLGNSEQKINDSPFYCARSSFIITRLSS